MTIRLHNTKTRQKEAFSAIDDTNVRMYLCGPTVYDRAHLGNGRPVVVFDVLFRLLRHVYGPDHVTYVRNFTDVDDKINDTALARKRAGDPRSLEALIHERTEETIGWYHADMDALGALRPTHEPRATDFVPQMVAMIANLIAKGHAYAAQGHVLFRVRSYRDYGALSGRSVDDMIAGARVEIAPFKEDPMDFVLWKPSSQDEPGWDSPWGQGRPGWHIECSAMSYELLGASFDIHGGGLDLQFPHHENEIAQSRCVHPEAGFAQVWLHNEMLQVEGKKMSKSLGNFFTVRDLLDQGVPGEVIRFVLLGTHYRSPMNWSQQKRGEAENEIALWVTIFSNRPDSLAAMPDPSLVATEVIEMLSEDLNTSLARTLLVLMARFVNNSSAYLELSDELQLLEDRKFISTAEFLGFSIRKIVSERTKPRNDYLALERSLTELAIARANADWEKADAIRTLLVGAGVIIRIGKETIEHELTANFDPAKLEALK